MADEEAEIEGVKQYLARRRMTIRALVWTGDNMDAMRAFCGAKFAILKGQAMLHSIHGLLPLEPGDYVSRAPMGTCVIYEPERFEATFEPAEEGEVTEWAIVSARRS